MSDGQPAIGANPSALIGNVEEFRNDPEFSKDASRQERHDGHQRRKRGTRFAILKVKFHDKFQNAGARAYRLSGTNRREICAVVRRNSRRKNRRRHKFRINVAQGSAPSFRN
ncbi:MAG: hypothetical protein WAL80_02985 [Xanthobacteraceae bacterium]|jgi:hypothetical protein